MSNISPLPRLPPPKGVTRSSCSAPARISEAEAVLLEPHLALVPHHHACGVAIGHRLADVLRKAFGKGFALDQFTRRGRCGHFARDSLLDDRLPGVIARAFRNGARFDAWTEAFRPDAWKRAFEEEGVDPLEYLRERDPRNPLPWEFVDAGIDRSARGGRGNSAHPAGRALVHRRARHRGRDAGLAWMVRRGEPGAGG